jgi:hypothetical protein
MKRLLVATTIIQLLISACKPQLFPAEVKEGVDPNFDFSRWRTLPTQAEHHKIQLGGFIVQSDTKGETVTIVAIQLPIVDHPAYGPKDTKKRTGEFAIVYQGKIDPVFLQAGNRLLVIGHTRAPMRVEVDDILRSLPTMTAHCIHFWNTGGRDIADFSSSGAGYEMLREETYCEVLPD